MASVTVISSAWTRAKNFFSTSSGNLQPNILPRSLAYWFLPVGLVGLRRGALVSFFSVGIILTAEYAGDDGHNCC